MLVTLLLGASAFYGVQVGQDKAANQQRDAVLANGDVVRLVTVLDGDTLVVAKEGQGNTTLRLLGIKSFESKLGKDRKVAKPELRIVASNPPESVAVLPAPQQVEMPFAGINVEPRTQVPKDLYIPPPAL